jgi:hypothetical protein
MDILAGLDAEELIIGDRMGTYEGTDEDGEVIIHFEDGSYQTMPTEEVYNHLSQDHDSSEIEKILGHTWAPLSGKLKIKVQWYTSEESLIEAEVLKEDNPLMLAQYILAHPVEQLRNGHWNFWAKEMVKKSIRPHEG